MLFRHVILRVVHVSTKEYEVMIVRQYDTNRC